LLPKTDWHHRGSMLV